MKLNEIRYDHRRRDPALQHLYKDRSLGTTYRDDNKPYGLTGEWLIAAGATAADIPPAMAKARQSAAYHKLLAAGLREEPTKRDETNGTFVLKYDRDIPIGTTARHWENEPLLYRILLQGRISGHSYTDRGDAKYKQTKLTSPKPTTVSSAPDLSPSDRIAQNYINSFEHLLSWFEKKRQQEFLKRINKD